MDGADESLVVVARGNAIVVVAKEYTKKINKQAASLEIETTK